MTYQLQFFCSALMVFVGRQERNLTRKNMLQRSSKNLPLRDLPN